jgi:hypothetical protein
MRQERSSLGIALSATRVLAVRLAEGRPGEPVLDAAWDANAPARGTSLAAILRSLAAKREGSAVHVALLPPLAEIRLVDLPPLEADELRALVARDISRLLTVAPTKHAVQVEPLRERAAPSARRVVSVADATLVEDVIEAVAAAGFEVASLGAASLAWERAARARGAKSGRWIVVTHGEREDALRLGPLGIDQLRRRSSVHQDAIEDGIRLAEDADAALLEAARHAAAPDALCLWPERTHTERTRRAWRSMKVLAAAALALSLAAGAVEWRSLQRSAQRVTAERQAIAPTVTDAMARRDSLGALDRVLAQVRDFETGTPRWLSLLADIERALPDDVTLLSLRVGGDTLTLSGTAERAAPVLEALAGAPGFEDVRPDGPIRQQVEEGEVIAEHFTVSLRSRRGGGGR